MQLFKRLARSLRYRFDNDPPEELARAYRETFKRWRYAPDTNLSEDKEKWLLIANRGGLFVGTGDDFCATLAYIVGGSFGELKLIGGTRMPVCYYGDWICGTNFEPVNIRYVVGQSLVSVAFPIRDADAVKAAGYELLIQGK